MFEVVAHALFTATAVAWFYEHRLFGIPVSDWKIPPTMLGVEFCGCWFHRTSHCIRWFWSAQAVHHPGESMNMTTAIHQRRLYSITGWWLFFMALWLLGVSPAVVSLLYATGLSYQYFVPPASVKKLHPWAEYFLVTPS